MLHLHRSGENPDEENAPLSLRRPAVDEVDMDITPMIDVTFLLLIFFLVASKLDTTPNVELPTARFGTAVPSKASAYITLAEGRDDLAEIYLGDGKVPETLVAGTPEQQESAVADYVAEALRGNPRKQYVVIKAGQRVKHREVSRVATAVGKGGAVPLFVAVFEVEQ